MIRRESVAHPLYGDDPVWLLCECVREGGDVPTILIWSQTA